MPTPPGQQVGSGRQASERVVRMADAIRVGIIGGGWPGKAHAKGYQAAGGFKIDAVSDLIPQRRRQMMDEFGIAREYADALELVADPQIDAVSICLPNFLHALA